MTYTNILFERLAIQLLCVSTVNTVTFFSFFFTCTITLEFCYVVGYSIVWFAMENDKEQGEDSSYPNLKILWRLDFQDTT